MSVAVNRESSSSEGGSFPPFVPPVEARGAQRSETSESARGAASRASEAGTREPLEFAESLAIVRASRIGSWQIVREIGRGGMGVVYEACDTVLSRRVALKVLPTMATHEPKKLARFEHEAQVVARLSHPHIVPLYSTGCENGLHFLVMQLVDGVSLDRVAAGSTTPLSGGSPDGTRILRTVAASASSDGTNGTDGTPGTNGTQEPTQVAQPDESHQSDASPKTAATDNDQWLRDRLFGEPHSAARYIATIGWQAAEALSYAHAMGVIHRDVKPSNLVVDHQDNVWITDFGLAQIQGEQGLTMTGDLLGTLRYMSPEQGMAQRIPVDHRTDVYSLGVTLYELLGKRPAFEAEDRKELLRQVLFDDPIPLRQHDPHIPPPLQVIVQKAMQKDPRARYATARAMADDLRRWLDGEPILARPPTVLERVAHWAGRRKGAVATALISLFVLLAAWAVVGQQHANEMRAELQKTDAARAEAVRGQFESLLLQAQARRATEQPGRRLQSLAAVTRAAELAKEKLAISESDRVRLRTETIAALAVPFDVEPLGEIELDFPNWLSVFDAEFAQLARVTDADGTITVSRIAEGIRQAGAAEQYPAQLAGGVRFPGFGTLPNFWQFSLDGNRLIVEYGVTGGTVIVWNLETGERAFQTTLGAGRAWSNSVSVGDRLLAIIDAANDVRLFDLVELREVDHFPIGAPTAIALTHDQIGSSAEILAVARSEPNRVEFIDLASHEVRRTVNSPGAVSLLLRSWSGGLVGAYRTASGYGFWDLLSSVPFATVEQPAMLLDLAPQRDVFALEDATGNTELRDTRTGLRGLRLDGRLIGFDASSDLLALRTTYRVSLYRLHRSSQVQRLRPPGQTAANGIYNVAFSSDSRLMAVSSPAGAALYDVGRGELIDTVSRLAVTNVAFVGSSGLAKATDDMLISAVGVPLQRWRKVGDHWEQLDRQFAAAEPASSASVAGNGFVSVSRDGRVIARSQFNNEAIVWRDMSQFTRLGPHPGLSGVATSPDGRRCVTGQHISADLLLWDTATGERLQNIWPGVTTVTSVFSPDGLWLAASSGREFRVFDTATWSVVWRHPRDDGSDAAAPIAFSPDSRQLAIAHNQSTMRLYSIPESARSDWLLYAELPLPESGYIGTVTFSPDGRWLARNTTREVFLWDLHAIRAELKQREIE